MESKFLILRKCNCNHIELVFFFLMSKIRFGFFTWCVVPPFLIHFSSDFEKNPVLDDCVKCLELLVVWGLPYDHFQSLVWVDYGCVLSYSSVIWSCKTPTEPHLKLSFWIYFGYTDLFLLRLHESPSFHSALVAYKTWGHSDHFKLSSTAARSKELLWNQFSSVCLSVSLQPFWYSQSTLDWYILGWLIFGVPLGLDWFWESSHVLSS